MGKIQNFIAVNITAFIVVVVATILSGPAHHMTGNFIWFQLGAASLCYLICGYRVFFAVLLAILFSAHGLDSRNFSNGDMVVHFIGTFSPILAIESMRTFKLSVFFDGERVVFQHLLFLAILTGFYNTIFKFFTYSYFEIADINGDTVEAFGFLKNYLMGDILGSLIILFFAALVVVPLIRRYLPNIVPKEYKID